MRKLAVFAVLFALGSPAMAIDTDKAFDDPALQARYEHIIEEVRCLKCQNQSIKDSNAFLAGDLRREIRRSMINTSIKAKRIDNVLALGCTSGNANHTATLILAICPTVAPTGPDAAATTTVSDAFGSPSFRSPA